MKKCLTILFLLLTTYVVSYAQNKYRIVHLTSKSGFNDFCLQKKDRSVHGNWITIANDFKSKSEAETQLSKILDEQIVSKTVRKINSRNGKYKIVHERSRSGYEAFHLQKKDTHIVGGWKMIYPNMKNRSEAESKLAEILDEQITSKNIKAM